MKEIKEILDRQEQGIDCSEEESAEIKGFVKEFLFSDTGKLINRIAYWLPNEYSEAIEEFDDEIDNSGYDENRGEGTDELK